MQFAGAGAEVRACTMADFVAAITGAELLIDLVPTELARRFDHAVQGLPVDLGPWRGHAYELFSELYAHVFGAASTDVTFSDDAVSLVEAHRRVREDALGIDAASRALRIGNELRRRGLDMELFGGLLRAREILRRHRAGDLRLPQFDHFLVDEVQDLTRVESEMILELARETAKSCGAVSVTLAGDEGQTVRPTDFEWGVLQRQAESIARARPIDFDENLRCPRHVAELGNAVGARYDRIAKVDRPRKSSPADVDESLEGKVLVARLNRADLTVLGPAIADVPSCAVVWPENVVPSWVTEGFASSGVAVWTPWTVKGLDFRVVLVLAPGRRLLEAEQLAGAANARGQRLEGLWSRSAIDQLRVCVTRASDTVVLVDFTDDPSSCRETDALIAELSIEARLTPDELGDELRGDAGTHAERAWQFVQDAESSFDRDPAIALTTAQRALVAWRRARGSLGASEAELGERANRIVWRGLFAEVLRREDDWGGFEGALSSAIRAAAAAHDEHAEAAARVANDLLSDSHPRRLEAARAFQSPEAWPTEGRAVVHRVAQLVLERRRFDVKPTKRRLLDELRELDAFSGTTLPAGVLESQRERIVQGLADIGAYQEALDAMPADEKPSVFRARCLEGLERYQEAGDAYAAAGSSDAAVAAYRTGGLHEKALEYAESIEHPSLEAIRAVVAIQSAFGANTEGLTESERKSLLQLARERLGAARPK